MNDTSPARNIFERVSELQARGQIDEAAGHFADYVDFYAPNSLEIPWIPHRDRYTREDVAEFFRLLPDHVISTRFEIQHVVSTGSDVVAFGSLSSIVKATGRSVDTRFSIWVSVDEGRIVRYHMYEDSLAVARAALGYR
jgi:ketosteroid isomerase-like protein